MVKLYCDKCGKDCGCIARDILINNIENPVPASIRDTTRPQITADCKTKRLLLCQACYRQTGLPNLFEEGLVFMDINTNKQR